MAYEVATVSKTRSFEEGQVRGGVVIDIGGELSRRLQVREDVERLFLPT